MCGIHAVVSQGLGKPPDISPALKQYLSSRGPDHFGQIFRHLPGVEGIPPVHLTFTSTVLALRGDHVATQPLQDAETGSVLCWNGEAWRLEGQGIQGNDAEAIWARLRDPKYTITSVREAYILDVLRSIEGPFAFLFYDSVTRRLYFGRDRLGRRSLLWNQTEDGRSIAFSSVADEPASSWEEVKADGIYSIHMAISTDRDGKWSTKDLVFKHDWILSPNADMVSMRYAVWIHSGPACPCYGYELTTAGLKHRSFQYRIAPIK